MPFSIKACGWCLSLLWYFVLRRSSTSANACVFHTLSRRSRQTVRQKVNLFTLTLRSDRWSSIHVKSYPKKPTKTTFTRRITRDWINMTEFSTYCIIRRVALPCLTTMLSLLITLYASFGLHISWFLHFKIGISFRQIYNVCT